MLALVFLALLSTAYGRSSRIINGADAEEGHFYWQISLLASGSHVCGGAIIGPGLALTAAHCVDWEDYFQVAVDEHVRSDESGNQQILEIDEIIKHPDYNNGVGFSANDIAILKLDDPNGATDDKWLPMAERGAEFVDKTCRISGWGVTENGGLSDILQWTDGKILSYSDCSKQWGSSYNHASHICIDSRKTGSCNGDSGGPMECDGVLAGLTSWGRTGCTTRYPSVYTRISNFRDWIQENL